MLKVKQNKKTTPVILKLNNEPILILENSFARMVYALIDFGKSGMAIALPLMSLKIVLVKLNIT